MFKRVSSQEKKARSRILVVSLVVLSLFLTLFVRLVYIQAFSYQQYQAKKEEYTSILQYTSAPRGQILDVNGKVLAKTVVSHNLVYTAPKGMSLEDYLIYASRLAQVLNLSLEIFSFQEQKEGFLLYCSLLDENDPLYQGLYLLSEQEREELSPGSLNSRLLSLIDEEQLKKADTLDLITLMIYNRMQKSIQSQTESVILEDIDDATVSYLLEHKRDFPGFEVDFTAWKREYPYGQSLRDVLGSVSTSTMGLPSENAEYYLARGFHYNSQVGISGLEFEYNDVLSGQEEIARITYDSNGLARQEIVQKAQKGNDLVLSIDIELQQKMDEQLREVLETYGGSANRDNFQSLFMCMMNPQNGQMLALSGWQMDLETKKMTYYASGNYQTLVNPGSAIKGATVFMGLQEGAIHEDEWMEDAPLNIAGRLFSSYENHGSVNEVSALSASSNVYMFQIALRMAGLSYQEGMALEIEDTAALLEKMRSYYSLFGLGESSGLDVPSQTQAYLGTDTQPAMALNFAIGQYDMYTPLQLLDYVSVIANGGRVYQPALMQKVQEIGGDQALIWHSPDLIYRFSSAQQTSLKRVQQGFAACVADGNCFAPISALDYEMAAKTGTAEVGQWTTANFVGYGPTQNPSVAFACSAPTSSVNSENVAYNICAANVVGPVLEKYFELYPQNPAQSQEADE